MKMSKSLSWSTIIFIALSCAVYMYALTPKRFLPLIYKDEVITSEYKGTGINMQPKTYIAKKTVTVAEPHPAETIAKVTLCIAWIFACAVFFATGFSDPAVRMVAFVFGLPIAVYILWMIAFSLNF